MTPSSIFHKPLLRLLLLLLLAFPPLFQLPGTPYALVLFVGMLPALPISIRLGLPLLGTLAATTALSPPLFALVALVGLALGLDVEQASFVSLGLFTLGFLFLGGASSAGKGGTRAPLAAGSRGNEGEGKHSASKERREPVAPRNDRRLVVLLLIIIAASSLLLFFLPLTRLWWRVRADSWFHAAVVAKISSTGIPPTDPYFSPLPLQYMYFYHVLLAALTALCGIDPFYAMIAVNFLALTSLVFSFAYLTGFFASRPGARALATAVCLFAMNGLFYLSFPIRLGRALVGETRGAAVLKAQFSLSPPGADRAATFLSVAGNQFLFLDKFLLGTALSLALGLVCFSLALALDFVAWGDRKLLPALGISALLALMLHLVVGGTALAAMVGAALIIALWFRPRMGAGMIPTISSGDPTPAKISTRGGMMAALGMGALVLAAPYLLSVLPRSGHPSTRMAWQWHQFWGILFDVLAPVLLLGWAWAEARRSRRAGKSEHYEGATAREGRDYERRFPRIFLGLWTLLVLTVALTTDLPTNNESKFSFLLFLPLAALSAGALDELLRRKAKTVTAFLLAATVPVNAIYFTSAFFDSSRFELAEPEIMLYRWIREGTPKDALFLEDADMVRIPVLAGRDLYWGNETYARVWGYPAEEMEKRRKLRDEVFSPRPLDRNFLEQIAAMRKPFYVVCRRKTPGGAAAAEKLAKAETFTEAFSVPGVKVYRFATEMKSGHRPGG